MAVPGLRTDPLAVPGSRVLCSARAAWLTSFRDPPGTRASRASQGLPSDCSLAAIAPQPLAEDGRVLLGTVETRWSPKTSRGRPYAHDREHFAENI